MRFAIEWLAVTAAALFVSLFVAVQITDRLYRWLDRRARQRIVLSHGEPLAKALYGPRS